jgi:hypothetical protein
MRVTQNTEAVGAALLFLGGTRKATDILPALGLVVVTIGVTQATTRGIRRAIWIVTTIEQRGLIDVLVAPVIVKDGDGATIMQPLIIGNDIIGRIPELFLPSSNWDGELATMGDKLRTFLSVTRVGRIAQG